MLEKIQIRQESKEEGYKKYKNIHIWPQVPWRLQIKKSEKKIWRTFQKMGDTGATPEEGKKLSS